MDILDLSQGIQAALVCVIGFANPANFALR
jgi:hypothetical protein